jgi:hypothetical protein
VSKSYEMNMLPRKKNALGISEHVSCACLLICVILSLI